MTSKPTHSAYVVIDPKEGTDKKAIRHEVGAIWPHKNGKGLDLVIPAGISVSGRVVCTERKEKAEQTADYTKVTPMTGNVYDPET
jgi:hypothetical protein